MPKKIKRWQPEDFELEMNTVWSFPKRGDWATHDAKWRGNWSPYIPRNILLRYSKENDLVLDQFAGGGTTLVEAKLLNRDIIGVDGVMAQVENDGFNVNGFFADNTMKPMLRNLRNSNNTPIYVNSVATGSPSTLLGIPVNYNNSGLFDKTQALMLAGDFTKAVYSIREDITYKVLSEAVIQNPDGTIAYNLAQQDMVALRCVMRLGVAVANPLTKANGDDTTRYPFAVLAPKDESTDEPTDEPTAGETEV